MFAAAVLGLAFLVRRRQPRLGLWAGALSVAGLLGLAAVITIDGYTWGVLGEVYQRRGVAPATAEIALHEVQQSEWSLVYYLTPLAWIIGLAMLAIGAARQGAVPVWAGALLALGGLMVGIETAVISNAYFIVAAAVLLAGRLRRRGRRDRAHERRGLRPRRLLIDRLHFADRTVGTGTPVPVLRSEPAGFATQPRGAERPGRAVATMSSTDLGHRAGRALPRVAVALALACLALGAAPAASAP